MPGEATSSEEHHYVAPAMPLPGVSQSEYTFAVSPGSVDTSTADEAADAVDRLGLCIVRGLVSKELSVNARAEALHTFTELNGELKARGKSIGDGTRGGFAEIVRRSKGRFEMPYKMDQGIFAKREFTNNTWIQRFVSKVIGPEYKFQYQRLLVSFPEAEGMHWHQDGRHLSSARHLRAHAMNIFVALGDITEDMGPTELRPASHFLTRQLAKMMLMAKFQKKLHAPVKPTLRSGDALIFDYRTLHCGTPNLSTTPRVMLELVYVRSGFTDIINFPKRSIFELEEVVESHEEKQKQKE
uniref:Phytanoyl-CoA dioxygenase n=1 Tax=Aplanochytrium stocchinoi TaxID=215587 RepID=A0A6S7ZC74_9STRA|mmetsp:Transcript_9787/g.12222  ORF Transcript_9787/g.12222 Transcript_9787/m.12222 type:complete len:298 (-) Transcript_9787:581-1474(-)